MGTDRLTRTRKQASKLRRRLLRTAAAVVLGVALGYICPELPVVHQKICHAAARLLSIFIGGG